ncbi:zinc finger CCCH domain-containing protein 11A isoform X2 [Fopius arisanus]|nr:PREDICTED: zinc finger CCCH domain-containing protein 11A-like isoform X2 [Fopius arisanus]XP_011309626.1 PREDICTED: zinc finger CCCH domain-containing protein 11A-like isoform X2 [Fopius arisanus]XP_011309627.1 PREDICTED: zinc finger CCCH domain-containing protein 11A-like isoform X2 [Fopius arisanus]
MEQNHKNNDCYFFYYSTCTKGDSCAFRHEPSALGCEVMCSYWQQGNCLNEKCNFRHMELKKNRKSIACYWESQRSGCKKPHCPFMHTQPRPAGETTPTKATELPAKPVNQEWSNRPDDGKFDGSGTESDQGRGSSEAGSFIGSPAVDPLIVNFDEESDSEGVASSPKKAHQPTRVPYCKTYEEIRLEEIQAESAAYYSYTSSDYPNCSGGGKEKRVTSIRAARKTVCLYSLGKSQSKSTDDNLSFKVLTLDEIKRRKNRTDSKVPAVNSQGMPTVKRKVPEVPLSSAIESLTELKKLETEEIKLGESRKRALDTQMEDAISNESKRRKINRNTTVPPVRLRRSPKRFNRSETQTSQETCDNETRGTTESQECENSRTEIEVRLCDSSTDGASNVNQVSTSVSVIAGDCAQGLVDPADDLKLDQLIDGHTHDEEDMDSASDDILKDIDALLTEKSV